MHNRAKYHFDNQLNQMKIGPYIIFQTGDLSCEAGCLIEDHVQVAHEISYVISGKGFIFANGNKHIVRRGMLVLNAIGDVHKIYSSLDDPLRYMYIGFDIRDDAQDEMMRDLREFYRTPTNLVVEDQYTTRELFVRLLTESTEKDQFSELLTECCVHQLLCHVYRLFKYANKPLYHLSDGGKMDYSRFVGNITRYIDTNIDRIKLSSLSREFGYSYTYIASVFLKQTGETLHEYYCRRRFEKACEYLDQGFNVTDTSGLLGYQSINAFSRAFKRHQKCNPSEYSSKS